MGEIRVKSENLFDVNGEHTSIVWDGKECLVIENDAIIVNQIRPGYMTGIYYDEVYKPGTYTFAMKQLAAQSDTTAIRVVSSAPFAGGAYIDAYKAYMAALVKHDDTHYITIVVTEPTEIGFFINWNFSVNDKIYDIQLLEGTYTAENIPEYKPYFLNRPAHQFTNGQWVDIPTHHYTNGHWQGELTSQSPLKFWADGEMLDWRIEGKTSGNLFDGELEQGSLNSNDGSEVVNNTRVRTVGNTLLKEGTYTINCAGATGGVVVCAYNTDDLSYDKAASYVGQWRSLPFTFVVDNERLYRFAFKKANDSVIVPSEITDIQLLEGTYTASTIPPYEPYGGVGERTENLFDGEYIYGYIDSSTRKFNKNGKPNKTAIIGISPNTDYVVKKFTKSNRFIAIVTDTAPISGTVGTLVNSDDTATEFTFNSGANGNYLVCYVSQSSEAAEPHMTVTLGSTAPPSYIPYGYKIPVRVEGENLWDGTFINTSGWGVSFSLDDEGYMVASSSSSDPRGWEYAASQIKMTLGAGTYALVLQGIPPTQIWSGAMIYTSGGSELANNQNLVNKPLIIMPFTLAKETSIGIMVKVVNGKYRVQLLEGSYTSDTLPPYEVNLFTDHQLMDGDSIDFSTDQTQIPIATGNNTLTVDTAVKPSKVFVKFEG